MGLHRIAGALVFLLGAFLTGQAAAQPTQQELAICAKPKLTSQAPADEDERRVNAIIEKITQALGTAIKVRAVACHMNIKAESFQPADASLGIPPGRYIVYGSDWVREVTGANASELEVLFGHEMGHFINDHFGSRSAVLKKNREEEADRFAGCVAARLGSDWDRLQDLLKRLRREFGQNYPDREISLEAARGGFDACHGNYPIDHITPQEQQEWDALTPGSCDALRGYIEKHPGGPLAQQAANRIVARRVTQKDLWTPRSVQLPLRVMSINPADTEDLARAKTLSEGEFNASELCNGLAAASGYRVLSSSVSADVWSCGPADQKTACGLKGKAICQVEARSKVEVESCGAVQ